MNKLAAVVFFAIESVNTVATAQTVYTGFTYKSCEAEKEPDSKFIFKANAAAQQVMEVYEVGKGKDVERLSRILWHCTVVDEKNWNCESAFAINGRAFIKQTFLTERLPDWRWCHYEKTILGGWKLIK